NVVYDMIEEATESAWIWCVNEDGSIGMLYAGIGNGQIDMADLGSREAKLGFEGMAVLVSTICRTLVGTGGITAVATALPLAPGHGWQSSAVCPGFIQVTENGVGTEIMKVTALNVAGSPDVATVVRDITGSGALAFTAAATITPYVPGRTESSTRQIGE